MKKTFTYLIMFAILAGVVGFISFRYASHKSTEEARLYKLLDRDGATSKLAEWTDVKKQGNLLFARLQSDPSDNKSKLQLASLFIQEARVTGNHGYYDKAAMKYVDDVLKSDSIHFEALLMKSIIELSQHHFIEGLATAKKAQSINPFNAFVYGLMIDGNVELGNYSEAVRNADTMVSIRPDLRSYSRISYLREIHGDIPGAIDAMKMAVDAGAPGDEGTEWCRVQLGKLYQKSGDTATASMQYNLALMVRPDYGHALAGLASIESEAGNYNSSITRYRQALASVSDVSIREELAEVYERSGDKATASSLRNEVISELAAQSTQAMNDPTVGHYSDRELAYAYLAVNDNNKALEHAMLEYNRRPDNIDVNEVVGWVYYRRGEYRKAADFMTRALKTNSTNPTLLARVSLVYTKAGIPAPAEIQQAKLASNSSIPYAIRMELLANAATEGKPIVHN